jgi:hypothetical protein
VEDFEKKDNVHLPGPTVFPMKDVFIPWIVEYLDPRIRFSHYRNRIIRHTVL